MTIKTIKHKVNKNGNYDWYCKHEILKGRKTWIKASMSPLSISPSLPINIKRSWSKQKCQLKKIMMINLEHISEVGCQTILKWTIFSIFKFNAQLN